VFPESETRHFTWGNETVAAPADAEKPGVRRSHWRGIERRGRVESPIPPGEESPRRSWIEPRHARQRAPDLRQVATRIQEDIGQRVPHFARRAQHVEVEAAARTGPPWKDGNRARDRERWIYAGGAWLVASTSGDMICWIE
jgi:hypothetical protein